KRSLSLFGKQRSVYFRNIFKRLDIGLQFIIETAFKTAALPGKLARVQGKILIAGSAGGYILEFRQPCRAAQLASADPDASQAAGFLPQADLPHLDPNPEFSCQNFDEFPKVDAIVRRIKESGLRVISLVLDV